MDLLNTVNLNEAKAEKWDVILVGSSFASMFFLEGLPVHLKVLIVEKGPFIPHSDQIQNGRTQYLEHVKLENTSAFNKHFTAHSMFGGNSNCWWACSPRMHPSDFKIKSLYGVGFDWQVSYDDLEPYYNRVEQIMEINGKRADNLIPRTTDYPFPAHVGSLSDKHMQAHSSLWTAQASARSTGGSRAPCCATGRCSHCPIDSKYTVINGIKRFNKPNVRLLLETEVYSVDITNKVANGVWVRNGAGEKDLIKSDLVGLGANALFNPVIMMRSGLKSDRIGRGIVEQVSKTVFVDIDKANLYGGTSITGHGYDFYDGSHRSEMAAVLMENFNNPASLRTEPGRWLDRITLKLIAEAIPSSKNRVKLEGDVPVIEWHGFDDYSYAGIDNAASKLSEILPFNVENVQVSPEPNVSEDHILCTTPMGVSSEDGVVDDQHRSFECSNLIVLGGSVFPTAAPANPTLTLSAMSLRAAEKLMS